MKKLREKKQLILEHIEKVLKEESVEWSKDVIKKLKEFSSNGKMIRGSLFLRTCEVLGFEDEKTALDVAVALELTQSGILTHDDVMDKDEFRRGKETIHKQYSTTLSNIHYGYSMAICFADIAFFESFKLIPEKLVTIYSNQMIRCAYGQMQDVHLSYSNREPTKEQILEVYKNKTARYTFSLPMMLAAKLAGKDSKLFLELGESLGIIFQIIDDQIGIYGDIINIGKTPGSDIKENKKTLHRYFLLHNKPHLKKYFGQKVSDQNIDLIKKEMNLIKPQIENILDKYQTKIDNIIEKLDAGKEFFKELSDYNKSRLK